MPRSPGMPQGPLTGSKMMRSAARKARFMDRWGRVGSNVFSIFSWKLFLSHWEQAFPPCPSNTARYLVAPSRPVSNRSSFCFRLLPMMEAVATSSLRGTPFVGTGRGSYSSSSSSASPSTPSTCPSTSSVPTLRTVWGWGCEGRIRGCVAGAPANAYCNWGRGARRYMKRPPMRAPRAEAVANKDKEGEAEGAMSRKSGVRAWAGAAAAADTAAPTAWAGYWVRKPLWVCCKETCEADRLTGFTLAAVCRWTGVAGDTARVRAPARQATAQMPRTVAEKGEGADIAEKK
mmetsp:Transcript_99799/g.171984  ORF Transcript_99799/g.171984 Transcript_99799/m.171984 type:complete len:289 (+) Transcript_99799:1406-2272(+)